MAPPAIYGEPTIRAADNGSVFLELCKTVHTDSSAKAEFGTQVHEITVVGYGALDHFDKAFAAGNTRVSFPEGNWNVIVTGADTAKTKWMYGGKQLERNDTYHFSHSDEGGNRKKLVCEIKNFDKPLAGDYKAVFYSADGENSATFTVAAGNAPDFHDKPHIVQRDNGNVIVIKVRAKSPLEMKAEWFKDDKPVKFSDRIKSVVKKDDKDKDGYQFLLEIHGPQKEDEAKYKCVVKNSEGQNQQSLNLVFD